MSDAVTVARLEEGLPELPPGTWLVIDQDGTVRYLDDETFQAEFDLNVVDEPEPQPEPVIAASAAASNPSEAEFNARVAERVMEILGRIPNVGDAVGSLSNGRAHDKGQRRTLQGRWGGMPAMEARCAATLAWLERTTGKTKFIVADVAKHTNEGTNIGTVLWRLRNVGMVGSEEIPGSYSHNWFLTEKGRAAAAEVGDEPFVLAGKVAPWAADSDAESERQPGLTG